MCSYLCLFWGMGCEGEAHWGLGGWGVAWGGWAGNYTYIGAFANLHLLQQRS
jgi:hypothetical protein